MHRAKVRPLYRAFPLETSVISPREPGETSEPRRLENFTCGQNQSTRETFAIAGAAGVSVTDLPQIWHGVCNNR